MTLWGSRFGKQLNPLAFGLNASLPFDQRLSMQDVRTSIAWADALRNAGVLSTTEAAAITAGLQCIAQEFQGGIFTFAESDEDIHTAIERRLGELIGPLAGKLHTGRSRNDQVATDLRLWMLDTLPSLDAAVIGLQTSLVDLAEEHTDTLMPGYTHLQRAQPISLAHWLMSHFFPFQRDRQRLAQLRQQVAILPLGCGALAGTAYPVDRAALAQSLGFTSPAPNSLDAVSDRDFAVEFLFCTAMIGIHLSKLAENVILFSTAEFGFFELSDDFATGSSLMPQKKNPDLFELARGKSGTLIGLLTGLLATLKALPSAYDKDLQEDKVPVFQACDTLLLTLPVISLALQTIQINRSRMLASIDSFMLATDLADHFVQEGIPFRTAHQAVGKAVQIALEKGMPLDELPLDTWQSLAPVEPGTLHSFDPARSIARRNAIGGASPGSVKQQILSARSILAAPHAPPG